MSLQKTLRFGMIGCGALGIVHTQRLNCISGVEISAVSDPYSSAMDACKNVTLNPEQVRSFNDYREMLKSCELDAVCISSPNPWHVEQLLLSVKSGLHALCEKPLTMNPEEARQAIEASEASDLHVAIGYQSRYRRDSRTLKRILASGEYGNINSVNLFACEDWVTGNLNTWRHDPKLCPAGYFGDANGHQIDLLLWLTGTCAERIEASIQTLGLEVPMLTWGQAVLKSYVSEEDPGDKKHSARHDFPLNFMFDGVAKYWREEISIQTDKADFAIRDTKLYWSNGSAPLALFPESLRSAEDFEDTPDSAFVSLLRGEQPAVSPPRSVLPVMEFTLAALKSAGWNSQT